MTEPPPRKRFPLLMVRWHLSTAIVLMFVAGALIWANVTHVRTTTLGRVVERRNGSITEQACTIEEYKNDADAASWYGTIGQYQGFPFDVFESKTTAVVDKKPTLSYNVLDGPTKQWHRGAMMYNFLVALIILITVWFLCEWVIRRRAGRTDA